MNSSSDLSFPQSNESLQKILWDPETQIERKNEVKIFNRWSFKVVLHRIYRHTAE
jgi:hypothetical protein